MYVRNSFSKSAAAVFLRRTCPKSRRTYICLVFFMFIFYVFDICVRAICLFAKFLFFSHLAMNIVFSSTVLKGVLFFIPFYVNGFISLIWAEAF